MAKWGEYIGMMDLSSISDERLETELAEREAKRREIKKPKIIHDPDLDNLRAICQGVIDLVHEEHFLGNEYYVFVCAMKTFFGKNVFDWINEVEERVS